MPENGPAGLDAQCRAFCAHHWDQLAAAAWRYFQRYGRGALLIRYDAIREWTVGRAFPFHLPYATELDAKEVKLEELISSYAPESSVVVAVTTDIEAVEAPFLAGDSVIAKLRSGAGVWASILCLGAAPPQAHAGQQQG